MKMKNRKKYNLIKTTNKQVLILKNKNMKKILLVIVISIISVTAFSQNNNKVVPFQSKIDSLITVYSIKDIQVYNGTTTLIFSSDFHMADGFMSVNETGTKSIYMMDLSKIKTVEISKGAKGNLMRLFFL